MKFKTESYTLPSSDGISTLHGTAVVPDAPWILLCISHGMAEHIHRYRPFMEILAQNGVLVFGHDHAGHGRSATKESKLGCLPFPNGADVLINDVCSEIRRFHTWYPSLPLFLFGHSMGSFIARSAVTAQPSLPLKGLILMGSASGNPASSIAKLMLHIACRLRGEDAQSPLMQRLMFGTYNERTSRRTEYDWLSTDRAAVDAYVADPLCGYHFPVSGLYALTDLLQRANTPSLISKTPNDLPILFLSGMEDPVGGYGNGIHWCADAYAAAGCTCVRHTLYTGARHELLNEPIANEVISDLFGWICHACGEERSPLVSDASR